MIENLKVINPLDFTAPINELWLNRWFLLTAGDFKSKHFNTMTVAWGFNGIMWNKPCVAAVVRPTRHTFSFMNEYDTFTLCSFPKEFRDDLSLLGSKSGRDGDKIALTKLHPVQSAKVDAPSFAEADLIFECRKIYYDNFKPEHFLSPDINNRYPEKDYHTIYFGEIESVRGIEEFSKK